MKSIHLFFVLFILVTLSCKKDPVTLFPVTKPSAPKDFLSDKDYKKLVIQVAYVNGYEPTTAAVNHMVGFLQQRLNKSSGVEVNYTAVGSLNKSTLNLTDIKDIEKSGRKLFNNGSTITMFVFFADADYFENTSSTQVLGLAYSSSSMVVFEKTIRGYSGGIGQPSVTTLEASVSEHEVGHILGLVNNGTSMITAHEGGPTGKHCTNTSCLMYYATETSDIVANLVGNNIPTLDNNCLNDLRANGGK